MSLLWWAVNTGGQDGWSPCPHAGCSLLGERSKHQKKKKNRWNLWRGPAAHKWRSERMWWGMCLLFLGGQGRPLWGSSIEAKAIWRGRGDREMEHSRQDRECTGPDHRRSLVCSQNWKTSEPCLYSWPPRSILAFLRGDACWHAVSCFPASFAVEYGHGAEFSPVRC